MSALPEAVGRALNLGGRDHSPSIRSRQNDGAINEENRPTIHLVYNYGRSLGMRQKRLAMIILPLTLNTCPAEL
jgi:hypothetical protein